jgi:Cof subfamily protein (haloacid dehalogenase superfamily)
MDFSGYLLVSDMDATLLCSDHTISDGNRDAIEYFTKNGGRFTVATGRMMIAVRTYLERININAPAILHNGAQIYDFEANKVVFEKFIEEERKKAIKLAYDNMPELGLEVYSNEFVYVYRPCAETERFKTRNYNNIIYNMPDEVWNQPWIKFLLIGEKELLDYYEPIYRREYDNGYAVRSGKKYLDIVAGGASKGLALKRLAKEIDAKKVIAIGDNMNDMSMLEAADISFAVANAEEPVKAMANYITPDNNSDAIASVIKTLEKIGE